MGVNIIEALRGIRTTKFKGEGYVHFIRIVQNMIWEGSSQQTRYSQTRKFEDTQGAFFHITLTVGRDGQFMPSISVTTPTGRAEKITCEEEGNLRIPTLTIETTRSDGPTISSYLTGFTEHRTFLNGHHTRSLSSKELKYVRRRLRRVNPVTPQTVFSR